MRLLYGLGNPGPLYEKTRHNIAARALLFFADRYTLRWHSEPSLGLWISDPFPKGKGGSSEPTFLVRSKGFMNLSGLPLQKLASRRPFPIERLLVLHDEIRLFFGECLWQKGGPVRGQRGLKSIVSSLGSEAFERLRIGVASPFCNVRSPEYKERLAEYLLDPFDPQESERIQTLLELVSCALLDWIEKESSSNFCLPDQPSLG